MKSTSSKLIESLDAFTDMGVDSKKYLLGSNIKANYKRKIVRKK